MTQLQARNDVHEIKAAMGRLKVHRALHKKLDANPTWKYAPSPGQLMFHRSRHPVRFLCPGNGWGKTAAIGHELQAWMTHSNRWRDTPRRQISALWFPEDYKQFELLLSTMREKCWGQLPIWRPHHHHSLVWPNGNTLYVAPKDRSWKKVQGVPIDLVLFDEHFPMALFTEMMVRGRGDRKTEIVIAATMTLGMTWEYKQIYRKWLDHHQAQGLTEDAAMWTQNHHSVFCWPKGGIVDNPSMSEEDRRKMDEDIPYSNAKEKLVRTGGGFQDWSGDAVFDADGLAWMAARAIEEEEIRPTWINAGTIGVKDDGKDGR